jgi:hypothetical protein
MVHFAAAFQLKLRLFGLIQRSLMMAVLLKQLR